MHCELPSTVGPGVSISPLLLADNDTMTSTVIGRDEELAAIGAFPDGVWSGPRALVFSGEAGIGKTLLWETGVAQAKGRVGRVLSSRGAEAEASLSFAALSELVGPVFDKVSLALAAPRRRALAAALPHGDEAGGGAGAAGAGELARALGQPLAGAERIGDPRLIAAMIAKVGHAELYAADPTPGLVP
jgi:hypothetical protein